MTRKAFFDAIRATMGPLSTETVAGIEALLTLAATCRCITWQTCWRRFGARRAGRCFRLRKLSCHGIKTSIPAMVW